MPSRATRVALLIALAFSWPAMAETNYADTVILKNGDRMTGNVRALAQGQLAFDTDAMGTIAIEWIKVAEILSDRPMQLETTGGVRYFGQLQKPPADDEITVQSPEKMETMAIEDVVHITPISQSFWKRLQGSLSTGFSFTKASDVAQFSFSGDLLYQSRRNQISFNYSNIITNQDSGTTQQLFSRLNYRYLLKERWFGLGFISGQRNQTLGIDGRAVVGAGAGRNLFESNRGSLALSGGLDLNLEDTPSGRDNSGELFGSLDYTLYKYKGNQSNLALGLTVFPNISEPGRVRWQINTVWRQELFDNFFWDWTLYGTGDNEPPEGATATNDYGIIFALGWTFGP